MVCDVMKRLRLSKNLNKAQTARNLGIPYTTYNNYETGARETNSDILIKLSRYYGVTVDYLLEYSPETENTPAAEATGVSEEDELMSIIKDLPEQDLQKVADYIDFLKSKRSD